jgi:Xaa-Pro aminopeptidase
MNFFHYLSKHLGDAKFVDMTDHVDQIKAVKSPEEIELIKECAAIQDLAIEHVKKELRPGRRTFEIHAEAQYSVMMHGSERQLILVNSGPQGTPVPFTFRRFQNRVLQEGDQVSLLIEVNGPGGFYAEIARIFSLGEPTQELQDAYAISVEAQAHSINLMKPGADPKEIWEANNEFLAKKGYQQERRLYAHGQGYDLVERPVILRDETMELKVGNNMTVHPAAFNDRVWATVCDNYVITKDGPGPCLHKTPKKIIVL